MNKLIGVIDEAGAFRPSQDGVEGFGIGAILFRADKTNLLVQAAKAIGAQVRKDDFKYKHVKNNSEARAIFIQALHADSLKVFGFYSSRAGVAEKVVRYNKAATHYGRTKLEAGNSSETEVLLDMFLGFAIGAIACHAFVTGYIADLYWDRRNDMDLVKIIVDKHVGLLKNNPRLVGAEKAIRFVGQTLMN